MWLKVALLFASITASLCRSVYAAENRGHLRALEASAAGPSCNAATQRLALLTVYNNTYGASWTQVTGWPPASVAMSPSSLAHFAASTPVISSVCSSLGTVLPDHCCWYGVQCCTPATCSQATFQSACSAPCSCTVGLVVGLALGLNNVSRSTSAS